MKCIYDHNGAVVKGLGNRNGKRKVPTGKQGGKRKRGQGEAYNRWIYEDATEARENLLTKNA